MKYQKIVQNPRRLKEMIGLDQQTFHQLTPYFEQALEQVIEHQTIDGYSRDMAIVLEMIYINHY